MDSKFTAPKNPRVVIFVRHGQSAKNLNRQISNDVEKYPLTDLGKQQANDAGRALEKLPHINGFYTSPVLRARETATIISKYIKIKPSITPLITERAFGRYNNTAFESKEAEMKNLDEQITLGYPEYESFANLQSRMLKFLGTIGTNEVVIAVAHRDPIVSVLGYLLGRNEIQMGDVTMPSGSFTIIDLEKKGEEAILAVGSYLLP